MRYAAMLIVLAAAPAARADGDRTLHLAIHGSVDGATIGGGLARELGVEVELVTGTCNVPCLDITVDGRNTATITYVPRSGAPRARAVALGNDTVHWPLVITLLAGNVVRDEAQDVLAGLPSRDLPGVAAPGPAAPVPPAPEVPVAIVAASPPVVAPTPAAAPPVRAPDEPREQRAVGFGFIPLLSTDLTSVGTVGHFVSVDLLIGVSGGSTGLTLSGLADVETGPVSGVQVGGLLSVARRVSGTQIGGLAAMAGDVDGFQVGGLGAFGGHVEGFQVGGLLASASAGSETQIGGLATITRGTAQFQAAGLFAVAGQSGSLQLGGLATFAPRGANIQLAGLIAGSGDKANVQLGGLITAAGGTSKAQLAGLAAVSGGDSNVQAAGLASISGGSSNTQISGLLNVAHRVRGLQLATVNIASEVEGVQIGVFNYGGSADGFSIGLINIVPGGRYDLEASVSSDETAAVLFRHGSRRWHNVYAIGGHPIDEQKTGETVQRDNDDIWMYGFGFGPTFTFDDTTVDLELMTWQVNHGAAHESDISILNQLRLSVAHRVGPVSLVAGGALNVYVTDDHSSPLYTERRSTPDAMSTDVTATSWFSAFVGLRI